MFRLWVKEIRENRLVRDTVVAVPGDARRTRKVLDALQEACLELDLEVPIWLDSGIRDFQRRARTRFTQDCFVETIPFDCLEIQVIEED